MINRERFSSMLKMTEDELYAFAYRELLRLGYEDDKIHLSVGYYIYAEGDVPVMLSAHLDTVATSPPRIILYNEDYSVVKAVDRVLGGDDRCGVEAIFNVIEDTEQKPYISFCCQEETGGWGSDELCKDYKKNVGVNFVIGLDRANAADSVYYDCGNEIFKSYINSYDFIEAIGSFSDIATIGTEWDVASVNLSIGYHHEHTANEFVILTQMQSTIDKVSRIVKQQNKDVYFDYQEVQYVPNYPTVVKANGSGTFKSTTYVPPSKVAGGAKVICNCCNEKVDASSLFYLSDWGVCDICSSFLDGSDWDYMQHHKVDDGIYMKYNTINKSNTTFCNCCKTHKDSDLMMQSNGWDVCQDCCDVLQQDDWRYVTSHKVDDTLYYKYKSKLA